MTNEEWYDKLIDDLSRIIARCRFGPGVDMGGKHNPRPSEIRAAKDFIDFNIMPEFEKYQKFVAAVIDLGPEGVEALVEYLGGGELIPFDPKELDDT